MKYELWDTSSGNLVERFDSEHEALQAARDLIGLNGSGYAASLALGAVPNLGHAGAELPPILEGPALLARLTRTDLRDANLRRAESVSG